MALMRQALPGRKKTNLNKKEVKKSTYFADLYVKVLNSDPLWFDASILKN